MGIICLRKADFGSMNYDSQRQESFRPNKVSELAHGLMSGCIGLQDWVILDSPDTGVEVINDISTLIMILKHLKRTSFAIINSE